MAQSCYGQHNMTLTNVPEPKLTALFALTLAIERIAELKPLAVAIYNNERFVIVILARSLADLTGSIARDVQSSLAAADVAPEMFASKDTQELSICVLLRHYSDSTTDHEIVNKPARRLMAYHVVSKKVLKLLNDLQALAASESFEAIIMQADHTRLTSSLRVYLTALQTYLRGIEVQVVSKSALSKQDMKRQCSDTEFFDDVKRALQAGRG
jgi:hypothetical protein